MDKIVVVLNISIHAPARGATPLEIPESLLQKFQSTLPRGERRSGHTFWQEHLDFNPRSREGSDFIR